MTRFTRRTILAAGAGLAARRDVSRMPRQAFDVIIVGAGLSGLAAARTLATSGIDKILVLDARGRVGGRAVNQSIAGVEVEAGGQWAGPTQTAILRLANKLGIETYPSRTSGRAVIQLAGIPLKLSEREVFTPGRMARAVIEDIDALAGKLSIDAPWTSAEAAAWDAVSVGEWIVEARNGQRAYIEVAKNTIGSLGGSLENSFLDFLWSVRAAGGLRQLDSFAGGAQDRRFVGGSYEIARRMAAELGDKVRLDAPVAAIAASGDDAVVSVGRSRLTARRVIVAMSPADANRIRWDSGLSAARKRLQDAWAMASVIKAHIAYDTPFWRAKGLSGFSTGGGLVPLTVDNTPEPETENPRGTGVLMMFLETGHVADGVETRRQAAVRILRRRFGRAADDYVDYAETNWHSEVWTAGCTSPQLPGTLTEAGPLLHAPTGPVHWAGTETAGLWRGYMDGAVRAGHRAAREVTASLQ